MCETFNSKTVDAREKAIITMLEEIRTNQLERIQIRGQWIKSYDYPVPPVIKETLDKASSKSSSWRSLWNGEHSYQVSGPPGQFVVNLQDKTCTCRLWQLRGIPCVHAAACILKNGHPLTEFVSKYYSRETMLTLYKHVLYPINGVDNWPRTSEVGFELEPPRTKRQRGRPRKKRRESSQVQVHADGVESLSHTTVMRCSRCGLDGHNKRTCKNDPRIPTPQTRQPTEKACSQRSDNINRPSTSNPTQARKVILSSSYDYD